MNRLGVVNGTAAHGPLPMGTHVAHTRDIRSRPFTDADLILIRRVSAYLPAIQLLELLNARLLADIGAAAAPYSMEQLQRTITTLARPPREPGWGGLRKLIEEARATGVLGQITAQRIDDFAVVWSLNAKQVVTLKDILLASDGDEE